MTYTSRDPEKVREYKRAWREKNKESQSIKTKKWQQGYYYKNKESINIKSKATKYKVSEAKIVEVLSEGKCEICGSDYFLHIDHDHESGKVRGLLCAACNTFLGKLEKYRHKLDDFFTYIDRPR